MIRRITDKSGRRLIVIGLDGASYNYLDPVLKTGRVPNFRRFFDVGARSDCLSTIPPLTPPAWSTMMTGVNPGKHGIFDFIQPDRKGAFRIVDARSRARRTFLDRAQDENIRVLSVLVPYTFPPREDANGLIISGLGTPSAESDFIRPHGYRDKILAGFPFLKEVDPTRGQSIDTLHAVLNQHTESTIDLTRFAMSEFPDWGISFTVFSATDLIPHFYSKFFDPGHPDFDPLSADSNREFRNSLNKIYEAIDTFLGESLDLIEREGGWIMLVSDHGSQPLVGAIGKDAFLAKWLEDNGYLFTGGDEGREKQAKKIKTGSLTNRLLYLAKKSTPHSIRNAFNLAFGRQKDAMAEKLSAVPFRDEIDWTKTRAFCAPGGYGIGLYINRSGDFPHGIVQKGADYHSVRDEIKQKLEKLEISPGISLFTRVLPREEAIWGPSVDLAPDLFLLWREDPLLRQNEYRLVDGTSLNPPEQREGTRLTWCGTHKMEGILVLAGDGVRCGYTCAIIPNLADILPTISSLCGIEIPGDVDGKMISDMFERDFLDKIKPRIGPPEEPKGPESGSLSRDESEKMIDLLEGLGYLN